MRHNRKRLWVWLLPLGSVFFTGLTEQANSTPSDAANTSDRRYSARYAVDLPEKRHPIGRIDLPASYRTVAEGIEHSKLFQARTWYTPPPQVRAALPARVQMAELPPPSAPPLPFVFIGRMVENDNVTLFLSRNGRQYAVKTGETIDGSYKVEKITDDEVVLTYLPMNVQQTLAFRPATAKDIVVTLQPDR